jgi:L-asparaginase
MVTFFCTGGTFDKIYFDANSEFSIGEPQIIPLLKEANISIKYDVKSILKKDSLDMNENDRQLVSDNVVACSSEKIVITHGTDGMVATAQYLAKQDLGSKTIVFVGAMQPARMRYSDAAFNLGFAVSAVQLLPPGLFISMNGCIFSPQNVAKNLTAGQFEMLK